MLDSIWELDPKDDLFLEERIQKYCMIQGRVYIKEFPEINIIPDDLISSKKYIEGFCRIFCIDDEENIYQQVITANTLNSYYSKEIKTQELKEIFIKKVIEDNFPEISLIENDVILPKIRKGSILYDFLEEKTEIEKVLRGFENIADIIVFGTYLETSKEELKELAIDLFNEKNKSNFSYEKLFSKKNAKKADEALDLLIDFLGTFKESIPFLIVAKKNGKVFGKKVF